MNKNSKIYIAGHTGMVGSAIKRELLKQGYENLIYKKHEELDLTKQRDVQSFFEDSKPEYVFIAAAKAGGINANHKYPADFLMENLKIQNNIFENAYNYKVKKMLFLGSACIYPKECPQPIKEEYLLTGPLEITNEPYSIAKIAGIRACSYYNRQFGTKFIGVIPANCYGINDSFDLENSHVIPALIRKYYEAREQNLDKVVLWGTGKALREFLYVDDLANACVFLMNNYDEDGFLNVGSGSEISMLELSQIIKEITGFKGGIECDSNRPDGMLRRIVDSGKINQMGWFAKTGLQEGLAETYRHFIEIYL
jgi:GDP-L-fucose synthase